MHGIADRSHMHVMLVVRLHEQFLPMTAGRVTVGVCRATAVELKSARPVGVNAGDWTLSITPIRDNLCRSGHEQLCVRLSICAGRATNACRTRSSPAYLNCRRPCGSGHPLYQLTAEAEIAIVRLKSSCPLLATHARYGSMTHQNTYTMAAVHSAPRLQEQHRQCCG